MQRFVRSLSCIIGVLLSLGSASAYAQDELRQELLDAWAARQGKIESVIVEWTTKTTISELALTRYDDGGQLASPVATAEEINRNVALHLEPIEIVDGFATYEETYSLIIDGDRYRLESSGVQPETSSTTLLPFHRVTISNGEYAQSLDDSLAIAPWPTITVSNRDSYSELGLMSGREGRAVLQVFRPLEFISLDSRRGPAELIESESLLDGQRGIVLRARFDERSTNDFWINPAKDYSIVHIVYSSQWGESTQDRDYRLDEATGVWIPAGPITYRSSGVNGVIEVIELTITSCEINPSISEDVFDLTIPTGAIVEDRRDTAEGFDPERGRALYFVKPDGTQRVITYAERFASYELISQTETGEAVVDPPSRSD